MLKTLRAALTLALVALFVGINCGGSIPVPVAGLAEFMAASIINLPLNILANALGGNVFISRTDLTLYTSMGRELKLTHNYNSVLKSWIFGPIGMYYAGNGFTDETGATYTLPTDQNGVVIPGPIPGTKYVVVDTQTIRTKQGEVLKFNAYGALISIGWLNQAYPILTFSGSTIQECTAASTCTTIATITPGTYGPTAISDTHGRTVSYGYTNGQLSVTKTPREVAQKWAGEQYGYDSNGRLSLVTTSESVSVGINYTADGRVYQVYQVGTNTPTYTFGYATSANGNVTTVQDPLGNPPRMYTWDNDYRMTNYTSPIGDQTLVTWNGFRPSQVTAPDGTGFTATYGSDDAPITVTGPDGNTETYSYCYSCVDPGAATYPLYSASDPEGNIVVKTYDSAGRVETIKNGANEIWTYTWNSVGNVSTIKSPAGVLTTESNYDGHSNPLDIKIGPYENFQVSDSTGRLTRAFRGAGQYPLMNAGVQRFGYDGNDNMGQLITSQTTLSNGCNATTNGSCAADPIWIQHRSDGQVSSVDSIYASTLFHYDQFGRLHQRCEPVNGVQECTTFNYDLDSRLISKILANGMETDWTYYADNNMQQVQTKNSTGAVEQVLTQTFVNAKLSTITDSSYNNKVETITYDSAGRPYTHTYPGGEWIQFGYTARSQISTETFYDSSNNVIRALVHAWDAADRPNGVYDGVKLLEKTDYVNGQMTTITRGNGLVETLTYDTGGVTTGSVLKDGSTVVLQSTITFSCWCAQAATGYNNIEVNTTGAITNKTDYWTASIPGDGMAWGINDGTFSGIGQGIGNSIHDELNNIIRDENGYAHTWNAEHNRLNSIAGPYAHTYKWDAAGFVTMRDTTQIGHSAAGRVTQIGSYGAYWDLLGRPLFIAMPNYSHGYMFGGRVETPAPLSTTPTILLVGGIRLHLDAGSTEVLYSHYDFRGNVDSMWDQNRNVVATATYSGYGIATTTGTSEESLFFNASLSVTAQLSFVGVRLFDEAAGQFLEPDPVYSPLNQYMYAYSNPINFGDKSGSTVGPAIPYGNPDDASAAASAAADIGSAAVGQVFDELSLIPFTGAVWNIFRPGAMRYGADRMWMRVWSTQFTLDMMDHFQWQALDRFQWMQAWRLHFPNNWIASFIDNWVLPGLDDLDFIGSMPSPGIPGGGGGGGGGSGPSGVSGGWNLGAIIEFGIIAWLLSLVGIGIF